MKHTRKATWFLSGMLCAAILANTVAPAAAALAAKTIEVYTGIEVFVDDKRIDAGETHGNPDAFAYNGTTYVAVAAISKSLGENVIWDGTNKKVYIGEHTEPEDAEESEASASSPKVFDCVEGESITVADQSFDQPITINGAPNGRIDFVNCTFTSDVTFNTVISSRVFFNETCEFSSDCKVIMAGSEKEATIETDLPKIITLVPINVESDTMGTVVAANVSSLTINGEVFALENCEFAMDPETDALVDFDSSMNYNCFGVAQWWENGEKILISFAFVE